MPSFEGVANEHRAYAVENKERGLSPFSSSLLSLQPELTIPGTSDICFHPSPDEAVLPGDTVEEKAHRPGRWVGAGFQDLPALRHEQVISTLGLFSQL